MADELRERLFIEKRRRALRERFEEFARPFPNSHCDIEELSELHADLAEFDGYAAGLVSSAASGAIILPSELDMDQLLLARCQEAAARYPEEPLAAEYLEYARAIEELLAAAREVLTAPHRK